MAHLTIGGLKKSFGKVPALRGIDLSIRDGEFCVFVGPSGCGKSTLLRAIAGLEDVDAGTIEIDGKVVNNLRPRDRNIAMVFQNYALYPYLTVFENIAFGLRARKAQRSEIETRVGRAAEMLDISALLDRYPRQLSGGQRQRVAIGRAIVRNVPLFLFDEPLSNLDAQLRDEMRGEIKRLHQEIGTTMIYVTHDQIEAMTLADQVVLMRDGLIEQRGSPLDLFERPATRFVAGFLGSPQMNFLSGRLLRSPGGDAVRLDTDGTIVPLPANRLRQEVVNEASVILGIRPEHMTRATHATPPTGTMRYEATIDLLQPTGSRTYATFTLGGEQVVAELQAHDVSRPGERTPIDINLKRAAVFDAGTERAL
ncbi:MAG: ABC transporter ATP-binding protein [Propylenella sp.]